MVFVLFIVFYNKTLLNKIKYSTLSKNFISDSIPSNFTLSAMMSVAPDFINSLFRGPV
jgi:hypothetical protein